MPRLLIAFLLLVASVAAANPPRLVAAAREQTRTPVIYDGSYARIIHNIGAGPVEDDILFAYPISGHYRYRVQ